MHWIYLLTNKINGRKYVGQDKKPPKRFYDHSRSSTKSIIADAIRKHGKHNFDYELIDSTKYQDEADDMETFYIKKHNSLVPVGYNVILDMALSRKNLGNRQKAVREKRRKILSKPIVEFYNQGCSYVEISKKMGLTSSLVSKIVKESLGIKNSRSSGFYTRKPFYQYDMEGNLINQWNSIDHCSETLNIDPSNIVGVLKKRRLTCHGFHLSYNKYAKEDVSEIIKAKKAERKLSRIKFSQKKRPQQRIKNIKQLDLDGNLIKIWKNSEEIVNFFKLKDAYPVLRDVRGVSKSSLGFKWSVDSPKDSLVSV